MHTGGMWTFFEDLGAAGIGLALMVAVLVAELVWIGRVVWRWRREDAERAAKQTALDRERSAIDALKGSLAEIDAALDVVEAKLAGTREGAAAVAFKLSKVATRDALSTRLDAVEARLAGDAGLFRGTVSSSELAERVAAARAELARARSDIRTFCARTRAADRAIQESRMWPLEALTHDVEQLETRIARLAGARV